MNGWNGEIPLRRQEQEDIDRTGSDALQHERAENQNGYGA